MAFPLRRWSAPGVLPVAVLGVLLAGCQPVREDRAVAWSPDGKQVAFQHGQEGIFIGGKEGEPPQKIFQPGPEVLASSTPLWSPDGKRLLFTTARARNGQPAQRPPGAADDPDGNRYGPRDVVYTCWLRDDGKDAREAVALFDASCDHTGYIAANLAVRWHHQGDRVLFVNRVASGQHALFAYDLKTRQSQRVFPHTAGALIFDWAPDKVHLVCVLGGPNRPGANGGVWSGRRGEGDWWPGPDPANLAQNDLTSTLERLRATLPVWTSDGTRFAFVTVGPPDAQGGPAAAFVRTGNLAT